MTLLVQFLNLGKAPHLTNKDRTELTIKSALIAAFLGLGESLILLVHTVVVQTMQKQGAPEALGIPYDVTISTALPPVISVSLLVFLGGFFTVLLSIYRQRGTNVGDKGEILYPSVLFGLTIALGVLASSRLPLGLSWANMIGFAIMGGIAAYSHNMLLYYEKVRIDIRLKSKKIKNPDAFAKRLELEHNERTSLLQWIFWAILVFVTAGIATTLFGPAAKEFATGVLNIIILGTVTVSVWAFIGLWFGVITPTYLHLVFIRNMLEEISLTATSGH